MDRVSNQGSSHEGASIGQQARVVNGSSSTFPPDFLDFWDFLGSKPSNLYGSYTWNIDNFSQINQKKLVSNSFEVGGHKWCIFIYPQGRLVRSHMSLFLSVVNKGDLLPGWNRLAQFTILVANKDTKKSIYCDALHPFSEKAHNWGWDAFMELSRVSDGFIDADTLVVKAQIQIIRVRADRPFRCLFDCEYRRRLVRDYLTDVEQIYCCFMEGSRAKLAKIFEDKARWSSFCALWLGMDQRSHCRISCVNSETILTAVVMHFFVRNKVSSTLIMDSLYDGLKSLQGKNKVKKSPAPRSHG